MNKPSFAALLYREWAIGKKSFFIYSIISLSLFLFTFLVLLSMKIGNLKLLIDILSKFDEVQEGLLDMLNMMKYMLVFAVCMVVMMPPEIAGQETKKSVYEHFRRSTPVSNLRLALAKTVILVIAIVLSISVGIPLMYIICAVMGTPVTSMDIGTTLLLIVLTSLLAVFQTIAVYLLKSTDKAGLCMLVFTFAIGFGIVGPMLKRVANLPPQSPQRTEILTNYLNDLVATLSPFAPFILIGLIAIYFVGLSLILKRREK